MSLKRMTAYNVGYGDCLLLSFENEHQADEKYYLLVDFGTRKNTGQLSEIAAAYGLDKSAKNLRQKLLKSVGNQIAEIVDHNEMDILVSHFHEDHFIGIDRSGPLGRLNIHKLFVSAKDIPEQLNKFAECKNVKIEYLKKANNYSIHQYSDGSHENINVLWPNQISEDSPDRRTFLKEQIPDWKPVDNSPPSPGWIDTHDTCLVFEVKGNHNKWCLFPGDASNTFNPYITNSALKNDPDVLCHFFPPCSNKYSFIKAPHHGTESWPLSAVANDCEVLITMADSHDQDFISSDYFNNRSVKKYYIMNCVKCNGKKYRGCSKCTAAIRKCIPRVEIVL